jgi:hypothetical protein
MWEALSLILVVAAVAFWLDTLRARESALAAGRAACERHGLQFLDETVSFARFRLARDANGRVKPRRTYVFEFSDTGDNRRQGSIVLLGAELLELQLEPYRLH